MSQTGNEADRAAYLKEFGQEVRASLIDAGVAYHRVGDNPVLSGFLRAVLAETVPTPPAPQADLAVRMALRTVADLKRAVQIVEDSLVELYLASALPETANESERAIAEAELWTRVKTPS